MEENYEKALGALFELEQKIDADNVWKYGPYSLWWLMHFRFFNHIVNSLNKHPVSEKRVDPLKTKAIKSILFSLVIIRGVLANLLRKKNSIVFVTSQTNLQKTYDIQGKKNKLNDVQIDRIKQILERDSKITVIEMLSFANLKNMMRSLLFRRPNVLPDMFFDFLRIFNKKGKLASVKGPENFQELLPNEIIETGKKDAERRLGRIELIKTYFKKIKPKAVVSIDENGAARDFIIAAKALNIPTFGIQHGIIHEYHPSYIYPNWAKNVPLVDYFFVFGDFYKQLLVNKSIYNPESVIITGNTRMSELKDIKDRFDKAKFRETYNIPADSMLVVFATQPAGRAYEAEIRSVFETLKNKKAFLLIKLHPGELEDDFYYQKAEKYGFDVSNMLATRSVDLFSSIFASDRFISIMSTTIAEAIILGASVGILDQSNSPDRYDIKDTSLVAVIKNQAELKNFIENGNKVVPKEKDDFTTLHYNGSLDNSSPQSIANHITQVIDGSLS